MFHPLITDLSKLKDSDIESKISELNKNYNYAARMGQGDACKQISLIIECYREEQQRRSFENTKKTLKGVDTDLDSLIKID